MKKILFLLIFLLSLSAVCAADNSTELTDEIALLEVSEEILLEEGEITVNEGESIQKAIDDASEGSTIIVKSGNYSEDLVVSKGLTIIGENANLNSKTTAFNILKNANHTTISGFNIKVDDSANGTGILINASYCKITDNSITGACNGIFSEYYISNKTGGLEIYAINNLEILRNNLSNLYGAGISVASFNPVVSNNRVTNIINKKENGTAIGIRANGVGIIPDNLTVIVTDNHISNVRSLNESAYGLDVGANSIFDTLVGLDVVGNVIEKVKAVVEAYGANIGVFSLNSTLPSLDISDIEIKDVSTDFENASAVGLSVSITTIGQNESSPTKVHDITVKNVKSTGANSKATGIDATGVGCADIYVKDNTVKNVKATSSATGISATGIDYTNFESLISVTDNTITDIESDKSKGINLMSLGNGEIKKNLMHDIPGEGTTFITGVSLSIKAGNTNMSLPSNATIDEIIEFINNLDDFFNESNITIEGNLTISGNNIEGTGSETGFAVVRPSEIHYNRAVNLKNNVIKDSTRTFLLESYGYDPSMSNEELAYLMLKAQDMFENCTEEELRNMSVSFGAFLDKFFESFDNSTAGDVDARYNWWGTNKKPSKSKFTNNNGKILYDPWLVLSVKATPKVIGLNHFSKVTADTYTDSDGKDHSKKAKEYFSGPRVTLTTDIGTFNGKKSVTLNWTNGKATAYLKGDEYGLATVTATDYESVSTTVLIKKAEPQKRIADAKEVKTMYPTGNPLILLVLSILLLAGIYKKR